MAFQDGDSYSGYTLFPRGAQVCSSAIKDSPVVALILDDVCDFNGRPVEQFAVMFPPLVAIELSAHLRDAAAVHHSANGPMSGLRAGDTLPTMPPFVDTFSIIGTSDGNADAIAIAIRTHDTETPFMLNPKMAEQLVICLNKALAKLREREAQRN